MAQPPNSIGRPPIPGQGIPGQRPPVGVPGQRPPLPGGIPGAGGFPRTKRTHF